MKTTHTPYWHALLFITANLVSPAYPVHAQENTAAASAFPLIQMTDAPLGQAVDLLARQSKQNYIIDPSVSFERAPLVNFHWTNITARAALDRLLKEHDLDFVENPATTVARIAPHKLHVKPVDPALVGGDTNAAVPYLVGNDTNATAIPLIMMTDAPLDQAIKLLAHQARLKIALDDESLRALPGKPAQPPIISLRWQKLTPRQALIALLDCYGLTLVEDSSADEFRIKPKPH